MSKTGVEVDKDNYKTGEEININIYGNYLLEEKILGGKIIIYICKKENEKEGKFKITKINSNEVSLSEQLLDKEIDVYALDLEPTQNQVYLANLDYLITILINEPADYFLIIDLRLTANQIIDGYTEMKRFSIPFTVTN